MATTDLILALTPLVSLLVTFGVKKALPAIPGWALPLVAGLAGVLPDLSNAVVTGGEASPLKAALLGLAATGIHQIKAQFAKPTPIKAD